MNKVRAHLRFPDDAPTGAGIRVAILDTGIDREHPDFRGAIDLKESRATASLSSDIVDRCGHGTHVAGIVAGRGIGNGQYRGMAPEAQLVIYKISAGGRGYTSDAIAAIDAAIGAGVDIINYSNSYSPREDVGKPPWVWPTELSEIERALVTAADHGILCVVAAGNDGPDLGSINRPAGIEEVLAIGAINSASEVTHQSSRGPYYTLRSLRRGGERRLDLATDRDYGYRKKPDVVAPGEEITGPRAQHGTIIDRDMLLDRTDPSCAYVRFGGTSHATAVVSGMAAAFLHLVRDRGIDLGPNRSATLRRLFRLSARKLPRGQEEEYGHGLVIWPVLTETLRDFVTDDDFRRTVLGGPGLTLLP